MLVDEVQISVKAGKGGDGSVHFHRAKFVPKGGPDGGDGGKGGDVILVGVEDIGALRKYKFEKYFQAGNGKPGREARKSGASAEELRLPVPVGTVIKDVNTGESWEMTMIGQEILIAKGGKGGRGNWHFRSSTNQTPMEHEEGQSGEERFLHLELQLIADIGFIGFPSVGKSSLLNELTAASVKTAPYPFTTLEPNLGAVDGLILADLPGLIEGASKGKGLGIKFLKHIRRTRALVHVIAADSENPLGDYEAIRKELEEYDPQFLEKPEVVVINKSDLVPLERLKEITKMLRMAKRKILTSSIHDWESIQSLKKELKSIAS
jgi:GTP-binding protein